MRLVYSIATLLIFILLFGCNSGEAIIDVEDVDGEDLYLRVYPVAGSNYIGAYYALHVPELSGDLKGILIIVPGYNSDGRYYKDEPVFKNFAAENNLAIISCYYIGDQGQSAYFRDAWRGSGPALMRAIEEFSSRKEMPELRDVPLVMWGHSAGGMFSYSFSRWKPEIVAAVSAVRSSEFTEAPTDSSQNVPVMFLVGQYDQGEWVTDCIDFVKEYRSEGALWAYAIEPDIDHSIGVSNELALPFLKSALDIRRGSGISHFSDMIHLEEEDGWLGNYYSKVVYPYGEYPNNISEAAWLPDENIANTWISYIKGEFSGN